MFYFTKIKLLIICRQIFPDYSNFKKPKPRHQHHVLCVCQYTECPRNACKSLFAFFFINVIGNRLIAESGDSKWKKFLFERISLAIQRGNAASIRALFQIPHYYRKFLHCKSKMLYNYVINTRFCF
jgi:hypothetical protein